MRNIKEPKHILVLNPDKIKGALNVIEPKILRIIAVVTNTEFSCAILF